MHEVRFGAKAPVGRVQTDVRSSPKQQTCPHPRRPVAPRRADPQYVDNLPAGSPGAFIEPCPRLPAAIPMPARKVG